MESEEIDKHENVLMRSHYNFATTCLQLCLALSCLVQRVFFLEKECSSHFV